MSEATSPSRSRLPKSHHPTDEKFLQLSEKEGPKDPSPTSPTRGRRRGPPDPESSASLALPPGPPPSAGFRRSVLPGFVILNSLARSPQRDNRRKLHQIGSSSPTHRASPLLRLVLQPRREPLRLPAHNPFLCGGPRPHQVHFTTGTRPALVRLGSESLRGHRGRPTLELLPDIPSVFSEGAFRVPYSHGDGNHFVLAASLSYTAGQYDLHI